MSRSRILVPIDFGGQSDAALHYAMKIATSMNEMISCIYVIADPGRVSNRTVSKEFQRKIRREAEQKLSERVNSILKKEDHIDFELIVTSGKVFQKILEKAMDLHVRLIVMGKSNSSDQSRKSIGSNTMQILSKSRIPVIAVSSQIPKTTQKIILPLNLLRPINSQIRVAVDVALKLNVQVIAISIIEKARLKMSPLYRKGLKDIKLLLNDIHIPCETHLLANRSSVSMEIASFSRGVEAGMILLLTKPETDHPRLSISATVREIIAYSEVPVLCFNPISSGVISTEDSELITDTNPLAWFMLKGQLMNYQKEI